MGKVLVVEDNRDNLRLITKVLKRGGYEVSPALCGGDGLRLAGSGGFSFIIVDINLPDMDGLELTKQLRGTPSAKVTPIIAITSNAMRGDMARILSSGCNGYFEKPIDPLTILDEIHRIIEESR